MRQMVMHAPGDKVGVFVVATLTAVALAMALGACGDQASDEPSEPSAGVPASPSGGRAAFSLGALRSHTVCLQFRSLLRKVEFYFLAQRLTAPGVLDPIPQPS